MIRILFLTLPLLFLQACSVFKTPVKKQLLPLEMTEVKGGDFQMGDAIYLENDDSLPLHLVELPSFLIGTYEVTYEQYDAFATATNRPLPPDKKRGRGKRAVVFVNWHDAQEFCNSYGYRLPTEQEWEYAARSGGKKHLYSGTSEADSLDLYARYKDNSAPYSYFSGSKKPNELGIYDMSGNVYEWIGDWYQIYRSDVDSVTYHNPDESAVRLIRGGSFREPENVLRTYWRVGVLADYESYDIGFRCVDPG